MPEETVEVKVKLPEIEGYEDVGYRTPYKGELYRNVFCPDRVEIADYDKDNPCFVLRKKRWGAGLNHYYDTVQISKGEAKVYTDFEDDTSTDQGRWNSGNYFKPDDHKAQEIADWFNQMLEAYKEESECQQ